ncbi:MAG: NusG domain II-containing protein [Oscillospiraceae bacterium]|nr:NusG domain II-containing protein [Oscillospiraceae bacterium]
MRLRFQKWDIAVIAGVILAAALVFVAFLPGNSGAYAQVYLQGQLVDTLPLNVDQSREYSGVYTNVVTVQNGKIAVTHSDCPGEDCVHSGGISAAGRSIVCLPNGLEIRVVGNESDVDFVVG